MDEKMSIQEYFEGLVEKLEQTVRGSIQEDITFQEAFFQDLMQKLQNLTSMLPANVRNLEDLMEEIWDFVKSQKELAYARNENYYNTPVSDNIRALMQSKKEEVLSLDDIEKSTDEIISKMKAYLDEKETTRSYRGKARENGYLKEFMEKLEDAFRVVIAQSQISLGQEDAYEFIRIIKNMQMEIGDFVLQSSKQNQTLQSVVEEVVSKYKGDVLKKVDFDKGPDGEKQETKVDEVAQEQDISIQDTSVSNEGVAVLHEESQASPEKIALDKKVEEAERIINEERIKQIEALKEMIALESQLTNVNLSPVVLAEYARIINSAKEMLNILEPTIGIGVFTGRTLEEVEKQVQQEQSQVFEVNDISVEKRDKMLEHFRSQDLPKRKINDKEYLIASEPMRDDTTGEIKKRGVIWTLTAYNRACCDVIGKDKLFRYIENKTETYMTLEEAIELGLYDDRQRKQKETSKNEYDDYSPFDAG